MQPDKNDTNRKTLDDSQLRRMDADLQDHEHRIRGLEIISHRLSGMATLLALEVPLVVGIATAILVAVLKA